MKDLYWLAGLLEGEGCFITKSYPSPNTGITFTTFHIQLNMTDKDIVERVAKIWKKKVNGPYITKGKMAYKVALHGEEAIAWMFTLYSLLGSRRKAKITEIIKEWKEYKAYSKPLKTHCKNGHLMPANRKCRQCDKLYILREKVI